MKCHDTQRHKEDTNETHRKLKYKANQVGNSKEITTQIVKRSKDEFVVESHKEKRLEWERNHNLKESIMSYVSSWVFYSNFTHEWLSLSTRQYVYDEVLQTKN